MSRLIPDKNFIMPFGDYKGEKISTILDNDPSYIVYLAEENLLNITPELYDLAINICNKEQGEEEFDLNFD